jgi:carbamoyl-phosphate synthase large subunit
MGKDMKENILLSGLGGSLFPYLHDRLKQQYNVYYVDSNTYLSKIYKDLCFFPGPLVTDQEYSVFIKNLVLKHGINYYIPLIDEEIEMAKSEMEGFNGVKVIAPNVPFTRQCLNKFQLMKDLEVAGISAVPSFLGHTFSWEIQPPLFVKPVTGRGSRAIRAIGSKEQLDAYYTLEGYKPAEVLIQPRLNGTEYTVGVTVNNRNNILSISSKRVIAKKGITQGAVTENVPAIDELAKKVVAQFRPEGPINIQLMAMENGELKVFEINPRFSTTSIMEYEGGVPLISLYIENYDNDIQDEIKRPKEGLHIYRRWESLFYE